MIDENITVIIENLAEVLKDHRGVCTFRFEVFVADNLYRMKVSWEEGSRVCSIERFCDRNRHGSIIDPLALAAESISLELEKHDHELPSPPGQ